MAENEQPTAFPHILLQGTAKAVPIVQDTDFLDSIESEGFDEDYDEDPDHEFGDCDIDCWECEQEEKQQAAENEAIAPAIFVPAAPAQPIDLTPDTKTTPDQFQYGLGFVQKFFQDNPAELQQQAPKPKVVAQDNSFNPTVIYADDDVIVSTHYIMIKANELYNNPAIFCRRCNYSKYTPIGVFTSEVGFKELKNHLHKCYSIPDPEAAAKKNAELKAMQEKIKLLDEQNKKKTSYCKKSNPAWHNKCPIEVNYNGLMIECICKCHKEEFPDEVI